MALFTHTYSGIITKGLGGPACCGLLTLGFSVFKCKIDIIPPPFVGGGGGSFPVHEGIYVPWKPKTVRNKGQIQITVKIKEHTWRRSYNISSKYAHTLIRISNFKDSAKTKIKLAVTNIIKRASIQIKTLFALKEDQ